MAVKLTDKYANIVTAEVTESAANTLTYQSIITGASLGNRVGWLIDEVDYMFPIATLQYLNSANDEFHAGITTTDGVSDLTDWSGDNRIIHTHMVGRLEYGTPANVLIYHQPQVYQFFPPLVTATTKLFVGIQGVGASTAGTLRMRIHYRFISLKADEYLELAEAFAIAS